MMEKKIEQAADTGQDVEEYLTELAYQYFDEGGDGEIVKAAVRDKIGKEKYREYFRIGFLACFVHFMDKIGEKVDPSSLQNPK